MSRALKSTECFGWLLAAALWFWLPGVAVAELEAEEIELKVTIDAWRPELVDRLETWVDLNTGSQNLPGLERFATLLPGVLEPLGFTVETREGAAIEVPGLDATRTGPIVVARRAARRPDALHFLVIAHYDTVFEPDSSFQGLRTASDGSGRAHGPGVADMKGGLVVMLAALRALHEHDQLDLAHWTVVLNGDEELGSLGSRETIEREAENASYAFVFESARPDGAMVRSRRGLGQFHFAVQGIAAHAGSDHGEGRSAVRALAEQILQIEALTDYSRGLTLNVGTVRGGDKRNIVPGHAEAWIDMRYDDLETGEEARRELERISQQSNRNGTQTRVWGTLHRPPKAETEAVLGLLALHAEVARDLGVGLPDPVHSGGGTDGSLTGAVGVPTLDTLGVVGGGAHTEHEYVELDSLPERAALAAILLRRLAAGRLAADSEAEVD